MAYPDANPLRRIEVVNTEFYAGPTGSYTVYVLEVELVGRVWLVRRRYSQFYALDEKLRERHPALMARIEFPPKQLFSVNPSVVESRRRALQRFVCELAAISVPHRQYGLIRLREVDDFLEVPQHVFDITSTTSALLPSRPATGALPRSLSTAGGATARPERWIARKLLPDGTGRGVRPAAGESGGETSALVQLTSLGRGGEGSSAAPAASSPSPAPSAKGAPTSASEARSQLYAVEADLDRFMDSVLEDVKTQESLTLAGFLRSVREEHDQSPEALLGSVCSVIEDLAAVLVENQRTPLIDLLRELQAAEQDLERFLPPGVHVYGLPHRPRAPRPRFRGRLGGDAGGGGRRSGSDSEPDEIEVPPGIVRTASGGCLVTADEEMDEDTVFLRKLARRAVQRALILPIFPDLMYRAQQCVGALDVVIQSRIETLRSQFGEVPPIAFGVNPVLVPRLASALEDARASIIAMEQQPLPYLQMQRLSECIERIRDAIGLQLSASAPAPAPMPTPTPEPASSSSSSSSSASTGSRALSSTAIVSTPSSSSSSAPSSVPASSVAAGRGAAARTSSTGARSDHGADEGFELVPPTVARSMSTNVPSGSAAASAAVPVPASSSLSVTSSRDQTMIGADDFLPIFMWVVASSHPTRLATLHSFLSRLTCDADRIGPIEYNLTSVEAAVSFIANLQPSDIDAEIAAAESAWEASLSTASAASLVQSISAASVAAATPVSRPPLPATSASSSSSSSLSSKTGSPASATPAVFLATPNPGRPLSARVLLANGGGGGGMGGLGGGPATSAASSFSSRFHGGARRDAPQRMILTRLAESAREALPRRTIRVQTAAGDPTGVFGFGALTSSSSSSSSSSSTSSSISSPVSDFIAWITGEDTPAPPTLSGVGASSLGSGGSLASVPAEIPAVVMSHTLFRAVDPVIAAQWLLVAGEEEEVAVGGFDLGESSSSGSVMTTLTSAGGAPVSLGIMCQRGPSNGWLWILHPCPAFGPASSRYAVLSFLPLPPHATPNPNPVAGAFFTSLGAAISSRALAAATAANAATGAASATPPSTPSGTSFDLASIAEHASVLTALAAGSWAGVPVAPPSPASSVTSVAKPMTTAASSSASSSTAPATTSSPTPPPNPVPPPRAGKRRLQWLPYLRHVLVFQSAPDRFFFQCNAGDGAFLWRADRPDVPAHARTSSGGSNPAGAVGSSSTGASAAGSPGLGGGASGGASASGGGGGGGVIGSTAARGGSSGGLHTRTPSFSPASAVTGAVVALPPSPLLSGARGSFSVSASPAVGAAPSSSSPSSSSFSSSALHSRPASPASLLLDDSPPRGVLAWIGDGVHSGGGGGGGGSRRSLGEVGSDGLAGGRRVSEFPPDSFGSVYPPCGSRTWDGRELEWAGPFPTLDLCVLWCQSYYESGARS